VALEHWHRSNRYCPRCGTETRPAAAGHMRVCPEDESQHFPRVDPAVIMLVTDAADRILLARGPQWPPDRRPILAGFVEPGVSREQAVAREGQGEFGVPVPDGRHPSSQPWPLPQSLKLGFTAKADGDVPLNPDPEEVLDAAGYTRDELREAI